MTLNVDFSKMEEPTQVDPGMYDAMVADMFDGVTKSGNDKIVIVFSLLSEGYEGRKVYADYVLSPKALPYLRRALIALGAPMDELRDKVTLNVESLRGLTCRVVIENTITPSGVFTKVKNVLPPAVDETDYSDCDLEDLM